jgi:two-component system, NarL family, nitrate/nitrite response regulator NarL
MNNKKPAVGIVIIDDHALFRESVKRLLNAEPDFEVVADCATTREALQVISSTHVDLVLLDFDLGEQTGADFFEEAKRVGFDGKVLVVTAGLSEGEGAELMRQGGAGIFMKHGSAAALAEGIRQVMSGKVWLDQQYLRTIFSTPLGEKKDSRRGQTQQLSERERRVLNFILEGLTNKQIADRLDISESSVKATLQQLFDKAGVRTRSQLVRVAIEQYRDQIYR